MRLFLGCFSIEGMLSRGGLAEERDDILDIQQWAFTGKALSGIIARKKQPNLLGCFAHGGDLGKDLAAVAPVFDHALDAACLSFNAFQTGDQLLVGHIV